MKKSCSPQPITPALRGQIIQRVIVDRWSTARAAQQYGLPTRLVDRWVADYRRHGMASLRQNGGRTLAGDIMEAAVFRPIRAIIRLTSAALRGYSLAAPTVQPLPLHRIHKDGPR